MSIARSALTWMLLVGSHPSVFAQQYIADRNSILEREPRQAFLDRLATAVAEASLSGVFKGSTFKVFASFYRSIEYDKTIARAHGTVSTGPYTTPHATGLAADVSLSNMTTGTFGIWASALSKQGLYIPFPWDPQHVEPLPGTDLFESRRTTSNPLRRQRYSSQVDRLVAVRDLVERTSDLAELRELAGAFPKTRASSESDAMQKIATFHELFSKRLLGNRRLAVEFERVWNSVPGTSYETPGRGNLNSQVLRSPPLPTVSSFNAMFSIYRQIDRSDLMLDKSALYLLRQEQWSLALIRLQTEQVLQAQRAAEALLREQQQKQQQRDKEERRDRQGSDMRPSYYGGSSEERRTVEPRTRVGDRPPPDRRPDRPSLPPQPPLGPGRLP